jgi:hypothetical protein
MESNHGLTNLRTHRQPTTAIGLRTHEKDLRGNPLWLPRFVSGQKPAQRRLRKSNPGEASLQRDCSDRKIPTSSVIHMKRWQIIVLAVVVVLAVAVIAGYRMGVRMLEGQIVEALGPGSRLSELKVNWFSIEC